MFSDVEETKKIDMISSMQSNITFCELMNYMKDNVHYFYMTRLDVYIFWVDIKTIELTELKWLPSNIDQKLKSYVYTDDRKRMLGGIMAYLYGVTRFFYGGDFCKLEKELKRVLKWSYNIYGKPFCDCKIHFNISHSGDYALCGFSKNNIGLDIECINADYVNIAYDFFPKEEALEIEMLGKEQQAICFTEMWVRKESFIKAIGKGLSMDLRSFSFKKISEYIWKVNSEIEFPEYLVHDINIFGKGYRGAVCCEIQTF